MVLNSGLQGDGGALTPATTWAPSTRAGWKAESKFCRLILILQQDESGILHSFSSWASEQRALRAEAVECFANRNEFRSPSSPARGMEKASPRWEEESGSRSPAASEALSFRSPASGTEGNRLDAFGN